jgi:IS5 family transposase
LSKAHRIRWQNPNQRGPKLYSWHAPEVECIGKGKAHKPYEFGVKVSITTTNRRCKGGQFVLNAKAIAGNPYDGHTLAQAIEETEGLTGRRVERVYVDKDYRGHRTPQPRRGLHLGPEARRPRRHQARAQATVGRRARDRTHEERRPPRTKLPQGTTQRSRQCRALGSGPQPSPHPLRWLRQLWRLIVAFLFTASINNAALKPAC